ncbi:MAG: recombinase family protein [Acidobacteria bacterium]|jgi:DNA invertase Pin-like site-specific DNA recombinase|nr:recombinase family protein [Acidobacteriota bacterium]
MNGTVPHRLYNARPQNGKTLIGQLGELRAYCDSRGWEIAGEYVDQGISGSKERRPPLDRLMADCRRRRVDAVVVYRYDRFARSLRHLVNALGDFDALPPDIKESKLARALTDHNQADGPPPS